MVVVGPQTVGSSGTAAGVEVCSETRRASSLSADRRVPWKEPTLAAGCDRNQKLLFTSTFAEPERRLEPLTCSFTSSLAPESGAGCLDRVPAQGRVGGDRADLKIPLLAARCVPPMSRRASRQTNSW
jgi:hypothetical protein